MLTPLLSALPSLREELKTCGQMDARLNLLLALRRLLVRHYHTLPYARLQAAPSTLRRQYYESLRTLTAAAPFPALSWSVQYAQTEQALAVLEQLAT